MKPLRFRFRLFLKGGAFQVEISIEGSPPVEAPFEFDLRPESRIQDVVQEIERNRCALEDLRDVGSQLWAGLLSGDVGRFFRETYKASKAEDLLFQIRLALPPALQGLPWEALYDEWSAGFLASRLHFCVIREPPETIKPPELPAWSGDKLRILTVVPAASGLQVEYEWQNLRDEVARMGEAVDLKHLGGRVTPDLLQEKLREGRYDIVHYIGHGDVGADGVTIRVNTEEGENEEQMMDGEAFAALFEDTPVRLAVLNCCLGAYPSPCRSLSGLGPLLMQTGVPAVVAMRYEISDPAAIRFSRILYRSLLDPASPGRIDTAVEKARRSLFLNKQDGSVRAFATPVLYLASGCEQLFDLHPAPVSPPSPPPPPKVRELLPKDLIEALREGRCVPVIGPDLLGLNRGSASPPGPRQLALKLANEIGYPRMEDFEISERAGGWVGTLLLPLVCQHYVQTRKRHHLVRSLRQAYEGCAPSQALAIIASWRVPGVVCTHFDGLLYEAMEGLGRAAQPIHALASSDFDEEKSADLLVIHLRGTLEDAESVVLTEEEQDALYDRLTPLPAPLVHLVHGRKDHPDDIGRTLLFLGVSPRDPIVRRISAQLLGPEGPKNRGTAFFACRRRDPVEEAYWNRFGGLEWIEADPEALLATLDAEAKGPAG